MDKDFYKILGERFQRVEKNLWNVFSPVEPHQWVEKEKMWSSGGRITDWDRSRGQMEGQGEEDRVVENTFVDVVAAGSGSKGHNFD